MEITLKPTHKQHEAYQLLDSFDVIYLLFGGGAGGGKSWLLCEWLLRNCYLWPESKWFMGRKERTRLMQSTYLTFQKFCRHHKIPRTDWNLNGQLNYIQFFNGSRIDLLDLDYKPSDPDYERFGSLEYSGGAIDEAGEIKFKCFDVLKTRINRHLNQELNIPPKLLLTANPTKNFLYSTFFRPDKKKELPKEYAFLQSLYMDNPFTAENYGKMLAQIKDRATKARLKDGNWEYDDDSGALCDFDAIVDLFTNVGEGGEKYITSDIARFGNAKNVKMFWDGLRVYDLVVREKQGLDQQATDLRTFSKEDEIPYSHILVDEDGVGGGLFDMMKGIKGFVANSSPILPEEREELLKEDGYQKENYRNLKSQCGYMLAEAINNHRIAITCDVSEEEREIIVEELEQLKAKEIERDAPLQIIPKEEIIENIGRSPDFLDTMLMRMYFELLKEKQKKGFNLFIPKLK
jgi:phage terminase large subunit